MFNLREYQKQYRDNPKNKERKALLGIIYRIKNRDKIRKYKEKYYLNNKKTLAKNSMKWDKNNRYKKNAEQQVRRAVAKGLIIKEDCRDCGSMKVHGHHPDYSKPLEVIWLCALHHKAEHKVIHT